MTAREALKELRDNLEIHLKASPMYSTDHCTINSAEVAAMIAEADEVLAKPERNCDVGTAEEQIRRYKLFCENYSGWDKCELYWAQTPYVAERKGDGDAST